MLKWHALEIDLNQMRRNGCTAPTQETKLACRGDIAGLDAVYIEHILTSLRNICRPIRVLLLDPGFESKKKRAPPALQMLIAIYSQLFRGVMRQPSGVLRTLFIWPSASTQKDHVMYVLRTRSHTHTHYIVHDTKS